ncbi:AraC family transcriptional regulator [Sphingobium sp. JS3065]|uniref:helix-turn-helix domain-containing protein n=1 Tax=Sphingobium sp. JS3065 TaxID=2970925 RepID=UPI002263ACAB|nr:AraC family transcriptional regulator [Sphingobium sp. JS3065]UZW57503.1 AraC family transcriptional regulator [Sphingobium sp. JS3065]
MGVNVLARVPDPSLDPEASMRWQNGLCDAVSGIQQRSLCHDMGGEFLSFELGGAELYYLHSQAQEIIRPTPCSKRFAPMVVINLNGVLTLSQNDRTVELHEGEFAFFDAANRLTMTYPDEFRQLFLRMPNSNFIRSDFYKIILFKANVDENFNDIFFKMIQQIWDNAASIRPDEYGTLLNSLLTLSHMTSPFREARGVTEPCVRMRRAMAFIENNLAESWLTAERVAEAQNVSRRYLDERFGLLGTRIEKWIWERRLARAHEDLVLAGRDARNCKSIIQIALDSGFSSPSHFSRAFKARFGMPPRELKIQIERESFGKLTH